jgi:hypothetical protein
MEINYYEKYLKYKTKYLELKAQLGGDDDKKLRLCHIKDDGTKRFPDSCDFESGCTNKYDKKGQYLGCKQKHCWGRDKKFCQNSSITTNKSKSFIGTTGCEFDKDAGCRMKCDHADDEDKCKELNECQWDGSCQPRENPCKTKDKEVCIADQECKWQSGYGFSKGYCKNK